MYRYYTVDNDSLDSYTPYISMETHSADYLACAKTIRRNPSYALDQPDNIYSLYNNPDQRFNHPDLIDDYIKYSTQDTVPLMFHLQYEHVSTIKTKNIESIRKTKTVPSLPSAYLPIATRYVTSTGYIFVERPPFQVDIDYKVGRAQSGTKKRLNDLKIWIPWTLFIFNPSTPHSFRLYFSSSSLTNMDQNYVVPFLPNTYTNGDICFSNSLSEIPGDSLDDLSNVSLTYSLVFNEYFNGGWNSDISSSWTYIFLTAQSVIANKGIDIFLAKFPNLARLLFPTEEQIQPLASKSKPISNYYKICNDSNNHKYVSIFSYLDSSQFYQLLLFLLSQFDLPDMLDLIDEVTQLPTHSRDRDTLSSRPFSDIVQHYTNNIYARNGFFERSIDPSSILNHLHTKMIQQNTQCVDYPAKMYNTHVLIYNSFTYNSFVINGLASPKLTSNYNHVYGNIVDHSISSGIYHKIISNLKSGIDISSRIYIYDYETPSSIVSIIPKVPIDEFYMHLVKNNFDYQLLQHSQLTVSL